MIPVYRDILYALSACRSGPVWPTFARLVYRPNQPFFDGLFQTYGSDYLGPYGLPGAVERWAPQLRAALGAASAFSIDTAAPRLLDLVQPLLPGPKPDLYLATLFFHAPASTISVAGKPAIALGMERFQANPPEGEPKQWYRPDQVVEMIPHEAAHAARMTVLGLPPTPRYLSLLDMVMLEGTALTFTDQLLGRMTLATFLPKERLQWHQTHDQQARDVVAASYEAHGMETFEKFFGAMAPVNGYYVGYSLCMEYLERYGAGAMTELMSLPSRTILQRLHA